MQQRIKEDKEATLTRRRRWGLPLANGKKKSPKKRKKKRTTVAIWFVQGGIPGSGRR
jgi:hypothetical protein